MGKKQSASSPVRYPFISNVRKKCENGWKHLCNFISEPFRTREDTTWQTSWGRFGPLSGLLCLVLAFAGVFVSFAILKTSDGLPTPAWKYQPSTYLAIIVAVSNQALAYAAMQGAIIAWWNSALQGSTLRKLHRDWNMGNAIWSSLTAGKHTNMITIACIVTTLVVADGPLLQRSTKVISAAIENTPLALQITVAPELPSDFSGGYRDFGHSFSSSQFEDGPSDKNAESVTPYMQTVFSDWARYTPLPGFVEGCDGTCRGTIMAPVLKKTKCFEASYPADFINRPTHSNLSWKNTGPTINNVVFAVDIGFFVDGGREFGNLTVIYATSQQCVGAVTVKTCFLESAIGKYEITIHNGTVVSPGTPEIIAVANNTVSTQTDPWFAFPSAITNSTLGGLMSLCDYRYNVVLAVLNGLGPPGTTTIVRQGNNFVAQQFEYAIGSPGSSTGCPSYQDPTDVIYSGMNELMFRSGIQTPKMISESSLISRLDPGLSIRQNITGYKTGIHNVYQTNFWFFLGAALLEACCIGLILVTYYGWWRLGRPVSFAPLEVAKAFEAPMLAQCNSNSFGDQISKVMGEVPIRYGASGAAVDRQGHLEHRAKLIAFAEPGVVYKPLNRFRFEM